MRGPFGDIRARLSAINRHCEGDAAVKQSRTSDAPFRREGGADPAPERLRFPAQFRLSVTWHDDVATIFWRGRASPGQPGGYHEISKGRCRERIRERTSCRGDSTYRQNTDTREQRGLRHLQERAMPILVSTIAPEGVRSIPYQRLSRVSLGEKRNYPAHPMTQLSFSYQHAD
jgi:hypothetical protein